MKIAIIGSNSFLASYLIREFMAANMELVLFGESPSNEFPDLPFTRFKVPEFPLNLSFLADKDVIIYTAGAGIQADLKEQSEIIYELNSFLPVRIFNFLALNGFKGKVITFGSYFEIGNEPLAHHYTEDEVATSRHAVPNHYCASKRILTRFLSSAPGLPVHYHLILPNIYGKGENQNRIIPYLLDALMRGSEIKLTSGSQVRQYIHVNDISRAVLQFILNTYPKGLYNLCIRDQVQIKTLVRSVYRLMDREVEFNRLDFGKNQRNDTTMPFLLLENKKTLEVLEFQPSITLEEGLRTYIQ